MCGIAGYLGTDLPAEPEALLYRAASVLRHRGPDGDGIWIDKAAGIGVASTRLAIQDLSSAGAQPMHSADGRYVIVYNGEIYNHRDVREELQSAGARPPFCSSSDTETLLEACAFWGVQPAVERLNGMFAFALWDRREARLYLVRDRVGIKPLYWGMDEGTLVFGSELKALRALWRRRPEIDRGALGDFLRFDYIPAPRTIYEGIYKLPPGCILDVRPGSPPEIRRYWDLNAVVSECLKRRQEWDEAEAAARMEARLSESVTRHLISDVPVGAFLSGGIDSSAVVALMQANSTRPVRTFTVGFPETSHDEAAHAARVARHLGTVHTELYVTADHAAAMIPRLAQIYDEPFGDSSQIPMCLIAELTRAHVTVALSGDGGDELFAGYNRHVFAAGMLPGIMALPRCARRLIGRAIRLPPLGFWNGASELLAARFRVREAGDKLVKLAGVLDAPDPDVYLCLVSRWTDSAAVIVGATEAEAVALPDAPAAIRSLSERMQYLDTAMYLPDDILAKVDRATMASSLECRVPYLDHEVLETAWRLPFDMKVRGGSGKWILRRILDKYVPRQITDRPKTGFTIPLERWLRGQLKDWAESLLDYHLLQRQGILKPRPIRERWAQHLDGRRNWHHHLWNVLMFQAWYERWAA